MTTKYAVIIFAWDDTISCNLPVPSDQSSKDIIGVNLIQDLANLFPDSSKAGQDPFINTYSQHFFRTLPVNRICLMVFMICLPTYAQ